MLQQSQQINEDCSAVCVHVCGGGGVLVEAIELEDCSAVCVWGGGRGGCWLKRVLVEAMTRMF